MFDSFQNQFAKSNDENNDLKECFDKLHIKSNKQEKEIFDLKEELAKVKTVCSNTKDLNSELKNECAKLASEVLNQKKKTSKLELNMYTNHIKHLEFKNRMRKASGFMDKITLENVGMVTVKYNETLSNQLEELTKCYRKRQFDYVIDNIAVLEVAQDRILLVNLLKEIPFHLYYHPGYYGYYYFIFKAHLKDMHNMDLIIHDLFRITVSDGTFLVKMTSQCNNYKIRLYIGNYKICLKNGFGINLDQVGDSMLIDKPFADEFACLHLMK